jgi:hypothetical protein
VHNDDRQEINRRLSDALWTVGRSALGMPSSVDILKANIATPLRVAFMFLSPYATELLALAALLAMGAVR